MKFRFLDHSANALLAFRTAPVPVLDMLVSPGRGSGGRAVPTGREGADGKGLAMLRVE